MSDFDFEALPGLPEKLPKGETLLWQGSPNWRVLARRLFRLRLVALYLSAMVLWQIVTAAYDGRPLAETAAGVAWVGLLGAICIGILCVLAWAMARTTIYTITSERLVMRYGVALPMTLNLPFRLVEGASAKIDGNGYGDLPLSLQKGEKIAYLMLWPHARPWHLKKPEPMLRSIPDAANVASLLARALAAYASNPRARSEAPANVQRLRPPSDAVASDAAGTRRIA